MFSTLAAHNGQEHISNQLGDDCRSLLSHTRVGSCVCWLWPFSEDSHLQRGGSKWWHHSACSPQTVFEKALFRNAIARVFQSDSCESIGVDYLCECVESKTSAQIYSDVDSAYIICSAAPKTTAVRVRNSRRSAWLSVTYIKQAGRTKYIHIIWVYYSK